MSATFNKLDGGMPTNILPYLQFYSAIIEKSCGETIWQ